MNKLKSYLSALIEAAFGKKKAFISNQAALDTSTLINIEGDTFTAPSDGAVRAVIIDTYDGSLGSGYISISGEAIKGMLNQVVYPTNASGQKVVWQSVAKGDKVSFARRNVNESKWYKTFFKTIGGGYLKSILQSGGGLCLRLKNTLKKQWGFSPLSLSRVQRVESINLLLQTKETGLLLLPQQVGQWLKQTQSTFVSTTLQAVGEWLCVQQKEFRVTSPLQQFRLIKGTHWSGLFSRFLETEQDSTSTTPKLSNLSLCTQGGAL